MSGSIFFTSLASKSGQSFLIFVANPLGIGFSEAAQKTKSELPNNNRFKRLTS